MRDGPLSLPAAILRYIIRRMGLFRMVVYKRYLCDKLFSKGNALRNPYDEIYVSPDNITHYLLVDEYQDVYRWFGTIQPGDWDIEATPIKLFEKYQGVQERFVENCEWENTTAHKHMMELIHEGRRPDGCQSAEDLEERYESVDDLYKNIKYEGYKSGDKLSSVRGDFNNICLAVGRDGRMILQGDGMHRTSIAKVLNLTEIPVKISMRHPEWQNIRDQFAVVDSLSELNNDLLQYVNHPDLQDVKPDS